MSQPGISTGIAVAGSSLPQQKAIISKSLNHKITK
jgi:hypothetical protein